MEIIKADEEYPSSSTSNISKGKKYMTDEKTVHIEHNMGGGRVHDVMGGYPAYGGGYGLGGHCGGGVFGIIAFIAFVIILWGVWAAHNRNSDHHRDQLDKHYDNLRASDKVGYEIGYIQKQLNDMQCEQGRISYKEDKILDYMCHEKLMDMRLGLPYGNHTQPLATARPQHCAEGRGHYGGGVINGSQLSDTRTVAVDHSQFI